MSISPQRRFATSPENELLKRVLNNSPKSTTMPAAKKKMSLMEYKKRQKSLKQEQRVSNIEELLMELSIETNQTRERVDSISDKLDFLIGKCLVNQTMFVMDDLEVNACHGRPRN
jgi:YesN/AraC family two-component response regulator